MIGWARLESHGLRSLATREFEASSFGRLGLVKVSRKVALGG